MILVTGAAGKTGTAVLRQLLHQEEPVRAWVRREAQADGVRQLGAAEVVVGDVGDTAVYHAATQNIRALYHICPNMHPDEVEIGRLAIAAAQADGVRHFVYHSVLHPQTEKMPHHWHKMRVEAMLLESRLPFTILQPTAYMQNIAGSWASITEEGVFRVPYPVETRLALVDVNDVAAVAAMVLTEAKHVGATYELVGVPALSQVAVAAVIRGVIGRSVRAEQIPLRRWRQQAQRSSLSPYQIEMLIKMFDYYGQYHFEGNVNVLRGLLVRPLTDLDTFIRQLAIG